MITYPIYIKYFPHGKYVTQAKIEIENAKIEIENMNFKDALKLNTLDSYESFMKKYPNSKYRDDITLRVDTLSYKQICADQSLSSYLKYLKLYPSGAFSSFAKSNRDSLLQSCRISDDESTSIVSKLEELAFPFTLNEIYVECSSEDDELSAPNNQHFKFITKSDMNLMGKIIKYRTSKRVVDKEISTKLSVLEGEYAYVEILKGKETILDLYTGDYKGKELIMVLRLERPVPNDELKSFGFESVKIYKEQETLHYLVIDDKWYKI